MDLRKNCRVLDFRKASVGDTDNKIGCQAFVCFNPNYDKSNNNNKKCAGYWRRLQSNKHGG